MHGVCLPFLQHLNLLSGINFYHFLTEIGDKEMNKHEEKPEHLEKFNGKCTCAV